MKHPANHQDDASGTGARSPETARAAAGSRVSSPARHRAIQTKTELGPRPANVILVGCGAHAHQAYVPALRALQEAGTIQVRSIVDTDERAREECRRCFATALPAQSLDPAIAPPDSLAIIATPARFHALQVAAALKRGWHVLCANPFAPTASEGSVLIAAADRQSRILAVDLPRRFYPAANFLRTLCRDHLLGPPMEFRVHEGMPRAVPDPVPPPGEKFESPDGVLRELGIPTLDLLTWCLGRPSVLSYADDAMGGVEANAHIVLSFPDRVRGSVHLSRDWATSNTFTFLFERGIVRWECADPSHLSLQLGSTSLELRGELAIPPSLHSPPRAASLIATPGQAAIASIQNILAAIARRETLRTPASEAMHALSIAEECYARRTPLAQRWLPPAEAVQARALAPPPALRRL